MRLRSVVFVVLGLTRGAGAEPATVPQATSEGGVGEAPAAPPATDATAPSAAPDAPPQPAAAPAGATPAAPPIPTAAEPAPEPPPAEPSVTSPPTPAHVPPAPAEKETTTPVATPAPRARDFGLELDIGLNTRLGQNGSYSNEQAYGGNYGLGAWVGFAPHVELGLELTHTELGRVSNERSPNLLWADHAVTTFWLGGRFEPWRSKDVATFVALRLGLGAQNVEARGTREQAPTLAPGAVYACSETEGPGVALGGGGGAALLLGPRVQLLARLDASAHRLGSDWLGSCAAGIGSVTSVSVGLGLSYAFGG